MEDLNKKNGKWTPQIQNYIDYSERTINEISSQKSGFKDSLQLPEEVKTKLAAIAKKANQEAKSIDAAATRRYQEEQLQQIATDEAFIQDVLDELTHLGR